MLAGTVGQVYLNSDKYADLRSYHLALWENASLLPDMYVFTDEDGECVEDEEATVVSSSPIYVKTA